MEFDEDELLMLKELIWEELDRIHHEPSRSDGEDQRIADGLFSKVCNEAKRRKLWWAR